MKYRRFGLLSRWSEKIRDKREEARGDLVVNKFLPILRVTVIMLRLIVESVILLKDEDCQKNV